MKLYYMSGACSMSCHIALEEAAMSYTPMKVDFDKPDANHAEMLRLNPLGAVPVLVTEQGKTLTQNHAILEHLADSKPSAHLLPAAGTWERAEANQWLSWVSSDLHKSFAPLFSDKITGEVREYFVESLNTQLEHIDKHLAGKDFVLGKNFSAVDGYLFTVVGWTKWVKVSTDNYKNLNAYMGRVYQRPSVQKAMQQEGLLN